MRTIHEMQHEIMEKGAAPFFGFSFCVGIQIPTFVVTRDEYCEISRIVTLKDDIFMGHKLVVQG